MRKLIHLLVLGLAIMTLENCTDSALITPIIPLDSEVQERSDCSKISQTYVDAIRSLSAPALGVSAGSIQIGAVRLTTTTSGIWIEPEDVVGYTTDAFDEILFVAYINDPTTDSVLVGYFYDTSYCLSPSGSKTTLGDLDSVVQSTLGFLGEDIDNI